MAHAPKSTSFVVMHNIPISDAASGIVPPISNSFYAGLLLYHVQDKTDRMYLDVGSLSYG